MATAFSCLPLNFKVLQKLQKLSHFRGWQVLPIPTSVRIARLAENTKLCFVKLDLHMREEGELLGAMVALTWEAKLVWSLLLSLGCSCPTCLCGSGITVVTGRASNISDSLSRVFSILPRNVFVFCFFFCCIHVTEKGNPHL